MVWLLSRVRRGYSRLRMDHHHGVGFPCFIDRIRSDNLAVCRSRRIELQRHRDAGNRHTYCRIRSACRRVEHQPTSLDRQEICSASVKTKRRRDDGARQERSDSSHQGAHITSFNIWLPKRICNDIGHERATCQDAFSWRAHRPVRHSRIPKRHSANSQNRSLGLVR